MRFRGIDFNIKMTVERGVWLWEVQTPTPKEGRLTSTREEAVAHAKRIISDWCSKHSNRCEPPTREEAEFELMLPNRRISPSPSAE
jgi:hypothetical protein